ncbi:DUF6519 domain-containing protein [Rhodovulum sp. DZ06]|uniref:DUF6519 domain-containing protein n=1 Tax=Rhodovulum sp. DZ06 TaxID=3425126 RepID=UPI003D34BCD8
MTMRNDSSRALIRAADPRRPRRVAPRQGQLLLDADIAEDARLALGRIETGAADALGPAGRLLVPAGGDGFRVARDGAGLRIGAGHGYVDGALVENPAECALDAQPHPVKDEALSPALVVLRTQERHVDPVEEPAYADKALGDAEAAGRGLQDWRVFLLPLKQAVRCESARDTREWRGVASASTGTVGIAVASAPPASDPCSLLPSGGYTGLENLHYRVEVHDGDPFPGLPDVDGPRFGALGLRLKVSRRNASLMTGIVGRQGVELTLSPPARDARNWFAPGMYAEVVSDHDDLAPRPAGAPERLFPVASASDDRVALDATEAELDATGLRTDGGWRLRLWDRLPDGAGWIEVGKLGADGLSAPLPLGDGLSVVVGGAGTASFRRGDCWTFAARADGTVDWPTGPGGAPVQERPHGPTVLYAPLASLGSPAPGPDPEDCRIPFAALSDMALHYRGGDGQGVIPPADGGAATLPGKLRLAVMRGETPVPNARVFWTLPDGAPACRIDGALLQPGGFVRAETGATGEGLGMVEVEWTLSAGQPEATHQVLATLGAPRPGARSVLFTARFDTARGTGYAPGACKDLEGVFTVQDALDALCARGGVAARPLPRVVGVNWDNDAFVSRHQLVKDGLVFDFSDPMDPNALQAGDSCQVTLTLWDLGAVGDACPVGRQARLPGTLHPEGAAPLRRVRFEPGWDASCLAAAIDRFAGDPVAGVRALRAEVALSSAVWRAEAPGPDGRPLRLNGSTELEFGGAPMHHGFARGDDGLLAPGDALTSRDFRGWFFITD